MFPLRTAGFGCSIRPATTWVPNTRLNAGFPGTSNRYTPPGVADAGTLAPQDVSYGAGGAPRAVTAPVPSLSQRSSWKEPVLGAQATPAPPAVAPGVVQVTRSNFEATVPVVREALAACDYYAFDCEMTGLHLDGNTDAELDGYEERYKKLADNAGQFLVIQFGLSAFVWDDGAYQARTFNFWLFPASSDSYDPRERMDRRFMCQASSLAFLAAQGFDFNKMITQGIPFMSVQQRDNKLRALQQRADGSSDPNALVASDVEAHLLAEFRSQVNAWLATGSSGPASLQVRPSSDRIRSLQRVVLGTEYGAAGKVAAAAGGIVISEDCLSSGETCLSLSRASTGGSNTHASGSDSGSDGRCVASVQPTYGSSRSATIREAAGFCLVLELMRDCRKPAVGHNMMYDIGFLLHSFAEPLPRSWVAFKALVQRWFPAGVYDTKHIALQLGLRFRQTDLASLYTAAVISPTGGATWPPVSIAPSSGGFATETQPAASRAHEAGFDAYMTGAVLARLARIYDSSNGNGTPSASTMPTSMAPGDPGIEMPSLRPLEPLRNRVHMMRTDLGHFALADNDPIPSRPNVLHVAGYPSRVTWREVVSRLLSAGYGKARVTTIAGVAGGGGYKAGSTSGAALVELPQPASPAAVAAALKKGGWDRVVVQKFSEYYYSQHRQQAELPPPGRKPSDNGTTGSPQAAGDSSPSRPMPPTLSQQSQPAVTPPAALPRRPLRRLKISPPPSQPPASANASTDGTSTSTLPDSPVAQEASSDSDNGSASSTRADGPVHRRHVLSASASVYNQVDFSVVPATILSAAAEYLSGEASTSGRNAGDDPDNNHFVDSRGADTHIRDLTGKTANAPQNSSSSNITPALSTDGDSGKGGSARPSFAQVTAAPTAAQTNSAQTAARLTALRAPKLVLPGLAVLKPQRPGA